MLAKKSGTDAGTKNSSTELEAGTPGHEQETDSVTRVTACICHLYKAFISLSKTGNFESLPFPQILPKSHILRKHHKILCQLGAYGQRWPIPRRLILKVCFKDKRTADCFGCQVQLLVQLNGHPALHSIKDGKLLSAASKAANTVRDLTCIPNATVQLFISPQTCNSLGTKFLKSKIPVSTLSRGCPVLKMFAPMVRISNCIPHYMYR